jgi:hypothetical protein
MAEITTTTEEVVGTNNPPEEWKSQSIDKLAQSLSKAQAEIKGAQSSSSNPFFGSKYADLHTVIESSLPYLTKYGLSVIQGNRFCDATNGFYVTTMLLHESGQWVKSEIRMPIGGKKDAHAIGSACTYGRRYGLSALTGVAQYDDDGNATTAGPPKKNQSSYKKLTNNTTEGVSV